MPAWSRIYIDDVDYGRATGPGVVLYNNALYYDTTGDSPSDWPILRQYSGNDTFLGLSLTEGATTPDYYATNETTTIETGIGTAVYFYTVVTTATSSISDLTGTKWVINDSPDLSGFSSSKLFEISFTSNSSKFNELRISSNEVVYETSSGSTYVYRINNPIGGGGSND